ncbi:phage holin family protein [Pseudoglutamicibacter cumminsii]|uniref:Phage holin family protein n=1 Tax=Pseudoglutamicibacter cumminsii TaxID=156979 RepID=A0AAP4FI32_9MICC|nr:phage holin family protein [Pseudoglutamicibacter cumminsii]MCT1686637.1 phage holin family protein [Pseudoglutamicibacter cumminsii]MDK6274965.1 phage holin family protein [Pseudoglutamicibacter cumminsii]MDK7082816.1 phage holin family protein [Pseudoglutamicibacter cumminsii]
MTQQEQLPQPQNLRQTASVMMRLAPKQINDEVQLTLRQLQSKGVSLGVAVALLVAGLGLLGLLVIALVVAAIAGLATVMPLWLSALLVAALFLILALIFVAVGATRAKNVVPEAIEIPKNAVTRLRYDMGALSQGTAFSIAEYEQKQKEKAEEKKRKKDASKKQTNPNSREDHSQTYQEKPSEGELKRRLSRRREHLAHLRDTLGRQSDVKARVGSVAQRTGLVSTGGDSYEANRAAGEKVMPILGAAAGIATALLVILGISKKRKKKKAKKATKAAKQN